MILIAVHMFLAVANLWIWWVTGGQLNLFVSGSSFTVIAFLFAEAVRL